MTDPRVLPPDVAPERVLLDSFLDLHRETLAVKCAGLTDDQLRLRPLPSSQLSLLGLVRHLTDVERGWFGTFYGPPAADRYPAGSDFGEVGTASVEESFAHWRAALAEVRAGLASVSLDAEMTDEGRTFSLRRVLLHMIEEYARHNGHADLLREAIDGVTGE